MLIWRGHRAKVRSLAFSPDGRRLASTAGNSKFAWLWDPTTGKKAEKFTDNHRSGSDVVRHVAFFPDGRFLAGTWERGGVTIWYTASGGRASVLTNSGYALYPDTLAVSPDGLRLFGCNNQLLEWITPTVRPPSAGPAPNDRAHDHWLGGAVRLGFSPKGTYFCVAESNMWLHDPVTLAERRRLRAPHGSASASAFAFTPDEARLAVAFGHRAAVWNTAAWDEKPVRIAGHGNLVRAIGFLPGGGTVFTAAMDGTVRLWDSTTGAEQRSFDWGIGKIQAAAVSPDGTMCAAGGDDGHIVVWDVDA